MIAVATIVAFALIAWKALDNHELRLRREHEVRIADVYRVASESVRKHEGVVTSNVHAIAKLGERVQHLEQWKTQRQQEGFGRGRS